MDPGLRQDDVDGTVRLANHSAFIPRSLITRPHF
jgi:hypothetical protein